jgi:hypothetical protein
VALDGVDGIAHEARIAHMTVGVLLAATMKLTMDTVTPAGMNVS